MKGFLVLAGLVLLTYCNVWSQQTRLTLKDKVSKQPVAFAHVIGDPIASTQGKTMAATTDMNGVVSFSITSPIRISTSFIGYMSANDTLYPGKDLVVFLEPTVYNVDEVVVTGQISPERVDKSIYKVKTLGTLTINQKAANNLTELLSGELNIRSKKSNVYGSSIMMQGMGGEHVKFLVDGVPVIGRQNGELDLDQMNMQNVDHVEIIEGPMSVIYGSNALAGVINVITKRPDRQKVSLSGEAYTESVGVYNFSATGSLSKGKNSVSFNGSRNFFGGFGVSDAPRYLEWNPKLQYDADVSYMFHTQRTTAKITLAYFDEEIRDQGNPSPIFNYDKAFDKYYFTKRWTGRGEWNQKVFKSGNLNLVSAYSYYSRAKNTYIKDLTTLDKTLYVGVDSQDTTWFDNLLIRPVFSNTTPYELLQYQLGFDLNHESGGGKRVDNERQEIGDYAAFLSIAYTPIPQVSIQPGIRAIYNTKYNAPLVYSLNVKYNIREELILRASVAKGFRAPSLKELYLYFVDINHNVVGNPDLIAETSVNASADLTYNTKTAAAYNWGFDFGVYYNHMKNQIQLAKVSDDPLTYSYVNVDQFYTQGFDLKFNNRVYPWLKLVLGYGVTGRRLVNNDAKDNLDYSYSNDVTAQSNISWTKTGLEFSVYYKYNGAFPELVIGNDDQIYISTIDAYNTLDANVSRWFFKRRLNVQAGAKNLFDNTDVNTGGYSGGGTAHSSGGSGSVPVGWGRTIFVKLQFNIL